MSLYSSFPKLFLTFITLLKALHAQSDIFYYCNKGVSYDSCTDECRILLNDGTTESCTFLASSQSCFCFDGLNYCENSSNCNAEEACVKLLPHATKSYCVPCEAIPYRSPPPTFVDSSHSCTLPDPAPSPYNDPEIADDYFQECEYGFDCINDCVYILQDTKMDDCSGKSGCFCSTKAPCNSSNDCPFGEACYKFSESAIYPYCVACGAVRRRPALIPVDTNHQCEGGDYTDQPTPPSQDPKTPASSSPSSGTSENGICVAAKHVAYLPKSNLIYNLNRRAHVLCDFNGSCATPGHMVIFNGVPMMMKTYCHGHVKQPCKRRIMFVNSPRMHAKLRIFSDSPGLEFTALAAQFETVVEERALQVLLRNGM